MSSYFPTSAFLIARIRADGAPAVRERRVADDTGAERSSSKRGAHGQHVGVLSYVKQCLPKVMGASTVPIKLTVVDEDVVEEHDESGSERVYRDCILEVVADGLSTVELDHLRALARSIVSQLSTDYLFEGELSENAAECFVQHRLNNSFSPDSDSSDAALLPLLGRPIAHSFKLKVPELDDLPMSGKFVSAPESAAPAEERVFKGRIASCSFLKKKRELVLLVDNPTDAKKKYEEVPVGYHPNQHEALVYPLLRNPEQVAHVRVTSSKIQRGNGSSSNSYELAAFLSTEEVANLESLGTLTAEGLHPLDPAHDAANDRFSAADALYA